MRRFLYILGAVTLAIIVAAGIGVGVLVYKGKTLDVESKAFVDSAVPAIAAGWNKEQLLDRATPELRDRAAGDANMSYMAGSGSTVSASYVAKAKFKDGVATIQITLVKRDGRWMISGFHVDTSLSGAPGRGI